MLTLKDISEIGFGKAGFSGYKPEDVDKFIDDVVDSFKQLMAERDAAVRKNADVIAQNSELQEKLAVLAEQIEDYRQEEDDIKEAVISAHRMAKDSVKMAEDKAAVILDDAHNQADQMLSEAQGEADRVFAEAQNEADDLLRVSKVEAAEASETYGRQIEEKKAELEEIKKQVTAFRTSLLEMYKKHLEMIQHIPSFRFKDEPKEAEGAEESEVSEETEEIQDSQEEESVETSEYDIEEEQEETLEYDAEEEPEEVSDYDNEEVVEEASEYIDEEESEEVSEYEYEEVAEDASDYETEYKTEEEVFEVEIEEIKEPEPIEVSHELEAEIVAYPRRKGRKSRKKKNQPQSENPDYTAEDYFAESSLTEVGIDTQTYTDIPITLKKEKMDHFNHLEFGEGIDVTHH